MSDTLNPYFVSGIVMATSVEDARDIAAGLMPIRDVPDPSDELGSETFPEAPTLLSVVPFDDNEEEHPIFFVEPGDPGPNHYLALVHLRGESEESVETELVAWLGNWNAYDKTLGVTEFDPDELEVDLEEALDDLEADAVVALREDDAKAVQ